MSRWWGDATRVVLLPDRIVLAQVRYRLRPRVLETVTVRVTEPSSSEGEPWRAPLRILGETLGKLDGKAPATVIVSNAFVQYALLPWSPTVIRNAERDAFARHHLKLRFGDCPASARVVASTLKFGQTSIACTMRAELVEEIERVAASVGTSIAAIEPLLMTVFNAYAAETTRRPGVLAIVEPGCASLVFSDVHGLAHVATRQITQAWTQTLGAIISQELAAMNTPFTPEHVLLFLTDPGGGKLPSLNWPVELLGPSPVQRNAGTRHAESRIALCGA